MKTISILVLAFMTSGAFASAKCEQTIKLTALNEMNKQLTKEVAPQKLTPEERASFSRLWNVDKDDNEVNEDTGIYEVEMGVMEECLTGMKFNTKKTANGCTITKMEFLDRDCG